MRDRHNIVGSEVGQPRPPVYLRKAALIRKKKLSSGWIWFFLGTTLLLLAILIVGSLVAR